MSTSSSSSSSSSSPSSSDDGGEGGNGGGGRGGGGGDFEGPSSSRSRSRLRSGNGVWPEPFLEALASHVAIDTSRSIGRLAAAPALFNLSQVCSTWRAVSHSDLLWQNLTRRIWHHNQLHHDSWYEEYIYHHRTARNFRVRRHTYTTLHFVPSNDNENNNNNENLSCRRLALSNHHLAAGFSDGSVRLFLLPTRLHLSTFHPHQRNHLGPFSRAVSGIFFSGDRLVFASHDGDIHVASINNVFPLRRAHLGDVVTDGVLVDFTGCNRWWVGLYAGVPGRSFHVRNGATEELLFIGGTLTDPEAVMGWHLLAELTELIGRIRITNNELAVACTSLRVIVFDLTNQIIVLGEEFPRGIIVGSVDARDNIINIVDGRGIASVRRVVTMEEVCRFSARGALLGCINSLYAMMCTGGLIRVWEVEHGEYLYSFRERIGETSAIVADERHVAACSNDNTIHLWDFGAH